MVEISNQSSVLSFTRGRIICEMHRAEVEPMQKERLPTRSGLWQVVIYEGKRFVRTDKDYMVISVAEKLAQELSYQFSDTRPNKGARH